jgi:nucleotide-binding universal stress UspA family protein
LLNGNTPPENAAHHRIGGFMFTRQLVLAAIDHLTDVERTLQAALRVATARGADVHVLPVARGRAVSVEDHGGWTSARSGRDAAVDARLASIARSGEHNGVEVRRVWLRGEPHDVIPAYAQLHQASLLVVERDYGSARFWRSGRVVNRMARQSPVPLLVLPKRGHRQRHTLGETGIVTPVDFSVASAVALRTAVDLSRRHSGRITVLHALEEEPRIAFSGSEAWGQARQVSARADAVVARLRRKAALFGADDVDAEVATGDADRAILAAATRQDAGLIVMGTPHRSWIDRLLSGSTLRRVLQRATVPVLVIPVVAGGHAWPAGPTSDEIGSTGGADTAGGLLAA